MLYALGRNFSPSRGYTMLIQPMNRILSRETGSYAGTWVEGVRYRNLGTYFPLHYPLVIRLRPVCPDSCSLVTERFRYALRCVNSIVCSVLRMNGFTTVTIFSVYVCLRLYGIFWFSASLLWFFSSGTKLEDRPEQTHPFTQMHGPGLRVWTASLS